MLSKQFVKRGFSGSGSDDRDSGFQSNKGARSEMQVPKITIGIMGLNENFGRDDGIKD